MNGKLAIGLSAAVLAACGGGGGASSPMQDMAMQARWSEAISSTETLKEAVTECLQQNDYVMAGNCDSLGSLQGTSVAGRNFLPTGYPAFWKYGGTMITQTAGTGAISIVATTTDMGWCVVVITPVLRGAQVTWGYTNSGTGPDGMECTRVQTGVGT